MRHKVRKQTDKWKLRNPSQRESLHDTPRKVTVRPGKCQ